MQRVPRLAAARLFDDVDADGEPGWKKGRDRGGKGAGSDE